MSRQSKNTKKRAIAKQFSEARQKGQAGPARTVTKHEKDARKRAYSTTQRPTTDSSGRVLEDQRDKIGNR